MFAPPSGVGGPNPDHLGTSTFLTDYNGNAYQFFLNLPFGETMAEQLGSNYYNTPYKFNGKELDEETGLYYYGARYYDPRVSIWLSVDPMAEKGPEYSSYCYSFNNPINLTDPDGRWPDLPSWGSIKKSFNEAKSTVAIAYNETKYAVSRGYNQAKTSLTQAKDNAVKTIKQTANDVQKWTKDNKEQLLKGANFVQKTGDNITTTGLISAAVGAPIAGVGAAPGLAVATAGGYVSLAGSVLEIGVKVITGDAEATGDIGVFVASEAVGFAVNKVLPGPKGEIKKEIKEAIKASRDIIKNETSNKTKEAINEQRK